MPDPAIPPILPPGRVPGHRFAASWLWRLLPRGMRRRWWLFRLPDLVVRHWPVPRRRRGLVVVRMDGIGDMVLFRGSLDHYAEAFDVAKEDITVVGCKSWGAVAGEVFADYRVLAIDEHRFAKRPGYRFRTALAVRRLNAAVVVCDQFFRRAMMADSLVWLSAAPRSIVALPYINEPIRGEFTWYLSQVTGVVDTGLYPTHEVIRHAAFVSAVAGRAVDPAPPRIAWRDRRPEIADGGPYVVLNPGSNEYGRRWPLRDYCAVARRVRDRGLRVVFVGSAKEKPDWDFMAEFGGDEGVIDLMGGTDLPGLLDVMRHAAAVLTNDTGPAHVAIALGAPTLVVVGGGHFGSFVPYPDGVRPPHARFVWEPMDCYHCFWRCPKRATDRDSFPCVAAVPVDRVWGELAQLLSERT
ncbi:MAG: glycosyltransferase family 9 protein [Hyphomicrobiales bacterium]|nr:glycosyltransferase family 9 protein [Hyphomicrobiales bacterium]MCP5372082.1 glycosyltransferase family 9 protein [Hyphomicrobiales bacterium]